MLNRHYLLIAIVIFLTTGCSERYLISDNQYRQNVHKDFLERSQIADSRKDQLFSVFNNNLTGQETEALEFLYAYMPLNDLADYNGDFFLACVDKALQARTERPWGKKLPDDIFLHYVLPYRVNNENLDSFRIAYYGEISDRINGLGLKEAALEINHWCHEKVSYQPSDIRTSSPMNTILSARGRCGEESTFTVSALRTAGIPARQVYCPRWAHTDDNHAWVEIWIDGKWYYMGACEPEPVLDRGWFTEPARRAMLVHTKSFGAPYGDENYINRYKYYSIVNDLSKYAVVKRIFVKVTDSSGVPVKDASVEYKLYNYSEFYTLAEIPTDEKGLSSFETGLGDLLIWARKGNSFGYRKITVEQSDTILLKLDKEASGSYSIDLDLAPPAPPEPLPGPSIELSRRNDERLIKEDEIRLKYKSTWIKPQEAVAFAVETGTDTAVTKDLLLKSMGNYRQITGFLSQTAPGNRKLAVSLLKSVAEKDLRDVRNEVFRDHLENIRNPYSLDTAGDLFLEYVLNPRVANEVLSGWRSYLLKNLPREISSKGSEDPVIIKDFIDRTIKIADDENYYRTPITPIGVYELKVSDYQSVCIFFIGICRSLGIPARLEPGSNTPQYYFGHDWHDVFFDGRQPVSEKKAYVKLVTSESNPVPEYYINFTLARFENGHYTTLEYDYNMKVNEFRNELQLAPGHYMLVTGNRLKNSRILSTLSFFDLKSDQHLTLEIKLRK